MTESPSLVLRRARLVPLPGRAAEPAADLGGCGLVDVRVESGRIASVTPSGTGTGEGASEVVDLDGRWLMPGLWDAHVHMAQWALARRRLDVSEAASAAEVARAVVDELRRTPVPDGGALVAAGFRDGLWPDVPTAELLDRAVADAGLPPVPVVVVSADLHCAWFSSTALAEVGVDHPTGLLRETEWMPLMAQVDRAPETALDAWVDDAAAAAARLGVVGIVDLEIADNLAAWYRRAAARPLRLRVDAALWPEHLDAAIERGLASGAWVTPDGLVRVGPFKVIADGSLNTRTAFCHEPYPPVTDGVAWTGALNVEPEHLAEQMTRAARHGIRCAIHAIGDHANAVVLDAFEATGARGSIEHAQLLTPDDVARMAALGVVASVQPEHALDDRDVADVHWAGRTGRSFAYADLARAGVTMTFGSDAPVARLDPWAAIAAAVTRTRDGREPWHPEQAVDLGTALASSVRSRVAPGEPADLVVLDAEPVPDGELLRAMPVTATMLAGTWTHRAL